MAKSRRLPPVHPGEVLREDLMAPLGLSINGLSRDLRVPVTRMSEIVNGRRSISAERPCACALLCHDAAVLDEPAVA
jgi:addiction module HigA family antidote